MTKKTKTDSNHSNLAFNGHGKIPVDWEITKLSKVGSLVGGGTPSSSNEKYWDGEIQWAVPTDITRLPSIFITDTKKSISITGLKESSATLLPSGSILVTSRATIGKCAVNTKPMATNQGFQSLICNKCHHNLFWCYAIQFHKSRILRLAYGTTFLEISKKAMKQVSIPSPKSFTEQQKIASILSGVDALIESTQETIEETERLKKGLMQRLLTKGIGHKKFKTVKGPFGKRSKVPEKWTMSTFGEMGEVVGGGTPDSKLQRYWNGNILWAVPTDITKLSGNYIDDTKRKITKSGLSNSPARLLPKGSILVTSRATMGECAIATKPISTNQGFQSLICNANFNNLFVFYLIRYHKNKILRMAYGTTFLEIGKNTIQQIVFPTPKSLDEQRKIASILSGIDA